MLETSIGGHNAAFPETSWTLIARVRDFSTPESREQANNLFQTYWKPVYLYFRRCYRLNIESAKDATQDFFQTLMARRFLNDLEQNRGSFRKFLKTAQRNYMTDTFRRENTQKRKGKTNILTLQVDDLENVATEAKEEDNQDLFDREWRRTLVEAAVEEVRKEYTDKGKTLNFELFVEFINAKLNSPQPVTYKDLALKYSIKESDVRNFLHAARERFRNCICRLVRDSTSDENEYTEELRLLFG